MFTKPVRFIASLAIIVALAGFALGSIGAAAEEGGMVDGDFRMYLTWHEPLSGGELRLYARPYRRCHDGGCIAEAGPITLADPLTVTIGTTATLLAFRRGYDNHKRTNLRIVAYRAEITSAEPIGDGRVRWRLRPDAPTIELPLTWVEMQGWILGMPQDEGYWVLDVAADWPDHDGLSARWSVLLKAIDGTGEQTFVGIYKRGSEMRDAFYPSPLGCTADAQHWSATGAPGVHFYEAFEAFCDVWAGAPGRTNSWEEWPAAELRFRGIIGPYDPTFVSATTGFVRHTRDIVITSELEINPTLSCGMDAGDLLLAEAQVEALECRGGIPFEHLRVVVRNVGSQPVGPYTVDVSGRALRDGNSSTIVEWSSAGLAVDGEETFRFERYRFTGSYDAVRAAARAVTPHLERFNERNNSRVIDPPSMVSACLPPGPGEAAQRLWLPVLSVNRRWR